MLKKLGIALAAIALTSSATAPAAVYTNPSFTSSLDFAVYLARQTTFTTPGAGVSAYVRVDPTGYAANNSIRLRVEVQSCGFWGYHWNATYVGGSCYITPQQYSTVSKDCSFNAPASGELHRLVFTKANDGVHYEGHVRVS